MLLTTESLYASYSTEDLWESFNSFKRMLDLVPVNMTSLTSFITTNVSLNGLKKYLYYSISIVTLPNMSDMESETTKESQLN